MVRRGLIPLGYLATSVAVAFTLVSGGSRELLYATAPLVMLISLTVLELVTGPWRPSWRDAPRDVVCFVLTSIAGGLAPALVAWSLVPAVEWPASWPWILALPFAWLAADFIGYWVHRLFHSVPLLWRFHTLHHLPTSLHTLVAGVDHPLFTFCLRFLRAGALLLLGVPGDALFVLSLFDSWQGLSAHTGVDTWNPWLARVLATPETHRMHHSREHDGNYGLSLTVWDRVFSTWLPPSRVAPPLGLQRLHAPKWWRALLF